MVAAVAAGATMVVAMMKEAKAVEVAVLVMGMVVTAVARVAMVQTMMAAVAVTVVSVVSVEKMSVKVVVIATGVIGEVAREKGGDEVIRTMMMTHIT